VIGASVAGLLAARVLADAYERVTIVERDELPPVGEGRKAVPQGSHAHVMLASGQRAVEELLPGISDELCAAGAHHARALREIRLVIAGHPLTREAQGADVLLASRPLIEGQIRRRVLALDNVTVRERCDAIALLASADRRRVKGVRVRAHSAQVLEVELHADLVVAASGRAARVPALLEAIGYPRPREDRLAVDRMYVSRRVRLRPGALAGDKLIGIGARPGRPRGLWLIAQEDHSILTAFGYGAEHHPPTDDEGFLAFAATVAPPDMLAAIRDSEPLGPLVTHRFPANQRRRYERLKRFPEGLLVLGDAISSFNPLYGQGMSVAALEAIELRRFLEQRHRRLPDRFFRAAGKIVSQAWDMAVGGDLALPEVAGRRPMTLRITNAYIERLLRVAEHDRSSPKRSATSATSSPRPKKCSSRASSGESYAAACTAAKPRRPSARPRRLRTSPAEKRDGLDVRRAHVAPIPTQHCPPVTLLVLAAALHTTPGGLGSRQISISIR
jgi:2-polyprenyl-6-methoxyphenol hydroxylase-like FAD-dependent oxidoreductase